MLPIEIFYVLIDMPSLRSKRDVDETINDIFDGALGAGDACGATLLVIEVTAENQCNEITKCSCDAKDVTTCKCTLEWWFLLSIVLVAVLILVIIIYFILKALQKMKMIFNIRNCFGSP